MVPKIMKIPINNKNVALTNVIVSFLLIGVIGTIIYEINLGVNGKYIVILFMVIWLLISFFYMRNRNIQDAEIIDNSIIIKYKKRT